MASGKQKMQTYDVFVGNLPPDANEKNIGRIFSKFGEIKGIFARDANTVPKKRYAFVNFLCEPDAERAIQEINGYEMSGCKLVVRRQETRKKFPGRKDTGGGGSDNTKHTLLKTPENDNLSYMGGDVSSGGVPSVERDAVMVTYVENPVTVWVQTVTEENTQRLMNITEQLAAVCPAAPRVNGLPQLNKVYASMFSEDGMWYRCCVKQIFGTETMKVQYIDYGNTEEVGMNDLLEIPQALASYKPLANKIVMHNTKVRDITDQSGIRFLRKLTDGNVVEAIKVRPLSDSTGCYAYLMLEGICINDKVIEEGFATKRPTLGSRGPGDNMQQTKTFGSNNSLHGTNESGSNSNLYNGGYNNSDSGFGSGARSPMHGQNKPFKQAPGPLQDFSKPPFSKSVPPSFSVPPPLIGNMTFRGPEGSNFSSPASNDQGHSAQQRAEVDLSHHIEIEKTLKSDLAKKKKEIDKLRTDLARKDLELQQLTANKVHIRSVVELAKKVRNLRLQFPTGRASGLEEAIDLALSSDKVTNSSVTSLQPVVTSLSTYRALQKEICSCKDVTELESLVETRDLARKSLYEKLSGCIHELEIMPLDNRHDFVKEAEKKVTLNYSAFLQISVQGCPNLEDLTHGFRDWKTKKEAEFCTVRENTNICQKEVARILQRLSGLLDLESGETIEKGNFEMDSLLKNYMQALQQEISITDMEHSRDCSLVATVLNAILNELHGELSVLENFKQFVVEFTQMKNGIEPWLDRRPNMEEILECRKSIRALKSKLRHKEADRQDLEESGDFEQENVIRIEISGLQYQLHQALVTHDQLVSELAKISDAHFPELLIKHQDMGIQTYLECSGIVKTGWEIDHFPLTPTLKAGMHSTVFCGENVYIQEFHIDDADHLKKSDFLAQIMAYVGITDKLDSLSNVRAVFFAKNERLAYVMTNGDQLQPLDMYIEELGFDDKRRQTIAVGLTQALNALHQQGFVHGEVNPQNVAVKPDGTAVLLCPDFSRSLFERAKRSYTAGHGMIFQAPEMMNIHQSAPVQLTAKIDLYHHGLLILYLHHPRSMIPESRDGTPNLAVLSLDPETGSLLYNLLCAKPDMRLAACHVLKSGYFTRVIPETPVHAVNGMESCEVRDRISPIQVRESSPTIAEMKEEDSSILTAAIAEEMSPQVSEIQTTDSGVELSGAAYDDDEISDVDLLTKNVDDNLTCVDIENSQGGINSETSCYKSEEITFTKTTSEVVTEMNADITDQLANDGNGQETTSLNLSLVSENSLPASDVSQEMGHSDLPAKPEFPDHLPCDLPPISVDAKDISLPGTPTEEPMTPEKVADSLDRVKELTKHHSYFRNDGKSPLQRLMKLSAMSKESTN